MESLNEDCGCPDINSLKISPICAKDGLTNYYSPCIAGCTEFELNLTTFTKSYSKCSVIENQWIENNMSLSKKWIKKDPELFQMTKLLVAGVKLIVDQF